MWTEGWRPATTAGGSPTGIARPDFDSSGRAIELLVDSDMRSGASFMIDSLAELAVLDGEPERAAHLFGFALSLRDAVGALPIPALEEKRARYNTLLQEMLGAEAAAEGIQLGAAFRYEDGVDGILRRRRRAHRTGRGEHRGVRDP